MSYSIKKTKEPFFFSFLVVLFNILYVFTFHFKYPFRSDLFLYGSLFTLILMTVLVGKIHVSPQTILFLLMVVSSYIGLIYTTMLSEGIREAVLFTLFFAFFVLAREHKRLIVFFVKCVYWVSVFAMFTVIIQCILPDFTNSFLSIILRAGSYDVLMDSYRIDGAYAGIFAYTPYTAFSSSIVFGQSLLNLTNKISQKTLNNKLANIILSIISVIVIILSSKRSLFVSIIFSVFIMLFVLYRKNNFIVKMLFAGIAVVVALIVLYNSSEMFSAFFDRFLNNDNFLTGRDTIYLNLWNDFLNGDVFLGRGTGATYKIADTGAHNIYLEILYDHGLLFSVPFYVFLLYTYVKTIKSKCYISIFVQSVFLMYGMAGNPLYSNMLMVIYVFYVLYAIIERGEAGEKYRNSNISQRA